MKSKKKAQAASFPCLVTHRNNLRDVHGRVGEEVGAGNVEPARNLLRFRVSKVLDVAALGLDVVRVEVCNGGNVRVRRLAVIALVVVVRQDLPVVVALHLPRVVKHVVVKVVVFEPRLLVNPFKVVLPRHLGHLTRIHVDPDKPVLVDVDMQREQAVFRLVKILHVLVPGRLGQLAVQPIRPPVILACQHAVVASLLGHNRECPVPADIVEGVDVVLSVPGDDELEAGHVIS